MKRTALLLILISFLFFDLYSQILHIPEDYPTIQQGIDIAGEGDTVLVATGTYYENLDFNSTNITLASLFLTTGDTSYISSTIINGREDASVIKLHIGQDTSTLICGFTITNGHGGPFGGGGFNIYYSSPRLEYNYIISNQAEEGGGIYLYGSSAVIRNCHIEQNSAVKGGGITVKYSSPQMSDLIISQNNASSEGGGIEILSSVPVMQNILIEGNSSSSLGGGLIIKSSNPKTVMTGINIIDNIAVDGAGIYNNGELIYKNGLISGNIASRYGGGIYSVDSLWIYNSTINNNSASYGGGLYINESSVKTDSVEISYNNVIYSGGGINCYQASFATLNHTILNSNTALSRGGGLYCKKDNVLHLSATSVIYNHSGIGGGLSWNSGQIVNFDPVNRCNIYLNYAEGYGSDLYSDNDTIEIIVDTFTVRYPTEFHVENMGKFSFDILAGKILQADADLYVSPSGNDTNTGLTPGDPMRTILSAYSRLRAGPGHINTVHLANGLYSPSTGYKLPLIMINYSSLSGESTEQTILDAEGTVSTIMLQNDTISLIEKLTIKGGGNTYRGGGIYSRDSEFHGRDLLVTGNTSTYDGGGLYISDNANSTLKNSIVENNTSVNGGGVFVENSGIEMQSVEFRNNISMYGGGMTIANCDTAIMNSLQFSNNQAYSIGGGLYIYGSSNLTVSSSEFDSNTAADGGGIYSRYSSPVISNSLFTKNLGIHTGSGVELYQDLEPDGGDIEARIINTTFADNTTPALFCYDASVSLINSIFWGDAGPYPYQVECQDPDTVADTLRVINSTVRDGLNGIGISGLAEVIWGDGNLDSDPVFLSSGDDPYELAPESPCIDAGTPDTTGLQLPYNDILGNTRVWDGDGNGTYIIDMGAYESGAPVSLPEPGIQVINTSLETFVYPNPACEQVTITWLNSHGRMYLSLVNPTGIQLQTVIIPSGVEKVDIDLQPFPNGIYFILLKDGSGASFSEKLILIK